MQRFCELLGELGVPVMHDNSRGVLRSRRLAHKSLSLLSHPGRIGMLGRCGDDHFAAVHTQPSEFCYRCTQLEDRTSEQDRFSDGEYDDDLLQIAFEILNTESPVRDDVLTKRIARAHGFARTGGKIRTRILDLLSDVAFTEEMTGRFLWKGEPQAKITFRYPFSDEDKRSIDEISLAELRGLIEEKPHLLLDEDPAVAFARTIGVARLSKSARERLEEAIAANREAIQSDSQ